MYRVTLDREACDGIFACLVRDDRFEEADDGLATLPDPDREGDSLIATFEADREAAESAAAACPLNAITVEDGEVS